MICKFDEKTRSELADEYINNHMSQETKRDYLSHVRRCEACEDELRATFGLKAALLDLHVEELETRTVPGVTLNFCDDGGSEYVYGNRDGIETGGIIMY